MSYEFKKLSEVEALTEVPEGATVLAEVGGAIKRMPAVNLAPSGNKRLIITSTDFDEPSANMSVHEAIEVLRADPSAAVQCWYFEDGWVNINPVRKVCLGEGYLNITFEDSGTLLFDEQGLRGAAE